MRNEPDPQAGSRTWQLPSGQPSLRWLDPARDQQFAHRVFHDVVDDVGRRVVDAAGLADFRLLLDLGVPGRRQADHLAQELLIDLS